MGGSLGCSPSFSTIDDALLPVSPVLSNFTLSATGGLSTGGTGGRALAEKYGRDGGRCGASASIGVGLATGLDSGHFSTGADFVSGHLSTWAGLDSGHFSAGVGLDSGHFSIGVGLDSGHFSAVSSLTGVEEVVGREEPDLEGAAGDVLMLEGRLGGSSAGRMGCGLSLAAGFLLAAVGAVLAGSGCVFECLLGVPPIISATAFCAAGSSL